MNKFSIRLFITYSLFMITFLSEAQDLNYAHGVINSLTSPSMHGRGYVNDGCKIAADYIKQQFDSLHLQTFDNNSFQEFSFPVNTFPSDATLNINGRNLIPGKDYIVEASSGDGHGSFSTVVISNHYKHAPEDIAGFLSFAHKKGQVVVFDYDTISPDDAKYFYSLKNTELPKDDQPAAIVFIENKKLTMDVSSEQFGYPVFSLLRSSMPKTISPISFEVSAKLNKDFKARNVIGYIKGSQHPETFLVYTAHYDHLGQMWKDVYFPGANDNASGMAMLLNLAAYYSKKENQPKCSIAFIAFAGEEAGLLGSKYFSEHPLIPLKSMKFLVNLDLLGTGNDGMMVVNATEFPKQFKTLNDLNKKKKYLKKIGQRGKARNSDHYWFTEQGVPSFYFYTMGGIAAYHDIYDRPETLPLTEFRDVFRLILDFNTALQK